MNPQAIAENAAAKTSVLVPGLRLLEAADLAALPTELPSGPVDYELDNGRIVTVSPPGQRHSVLQSRIVYALVSHENEASSGRAFVEVGIVLWRGPDRVVAADAAFVCAASLPVKETAEGYLETIPDLVVEIRSKNDTPDALDRKADDYLRAGVRLVWIVDDDAKCVTARDHASAKTFGAGDTLTAGEIIPGFQVAVDEILRP